MSRAERNSFSRRARACGLGLALFALAAAGAGAAEFGEPVLLGPLDPTIDRFFGVEVAIDRDTLAVGASGSPEGGVVYIYQRQQSSTEPWKLIRMLTAGDGGNFENFGEALALEGDTLVIGAPGDSTRGRSAGAVYVHYRDRGGPGRWGRARTLAPQNLRRDAWYGGAVALSGDRLAVGALGAGRVYVHERNRAGRDRWGVQSEVSGEVTSSVVRDHFGITGRPLGFGTAVAMSGRTLAAGAIDYYQKYSVPLPVYSFGAFRFDLEEGGAWNQRYHYAPPALRNSGKTDNFGGTLAMDGPVLLAGGGGGLDSGAYVYERDVGGRDQWRQRMELHGPSDFGRAIQVALRGNTAAIAGHFTTDVEPFAGKGALIYEHHTPGRNQWGLVARLINPAITTTVTGLAIGPSEVVLGHPSTGVVQIFPRLPLAGSDFESGEISGFSRAVGAISVVSPGLAGTEHALAVRVTGGHKVSALRARQPVRETRVSVGFDLAANRVDLGESRVEVMNLYGPSRNLVRLTLEADPLRDQYFLTLWAWEEGTGWFQAGRTRMPPMRGVRVEVEWRAATGPGADDGRIRLVTDGRVRVQRKNLDTDQQVVNGLLIGLPKGSPGTLGGEFLLDQIALHR